MEQLIRQLEGFQPWNEQENRDRELILALLRRGDPAIFTRESTAFHMTTSAWVSNRSRSRVLMAYHNLYGSWAWLGGHADGDTDLLRVALREVTEESGVDAAPILTDPFSVEVLTVDGHEKRGRYVSSHLHLNVTYLLEADSAAPVRAKADENSAVGWFPPEEAVARSTEPWFRARIYQKLNEKLRSL